MNPKTVTTLTFLAAALLLCGAMIPSPLGSVAGVVLAGIVAVLPVAFGSIKLKATGAAILVAALALAISSFSDARKEMARYTTQARDR